MRIPAAVSSIFGWKPEILYLHTSKQISNRGMDTADIGLSVFIMLFGWKGERRIPAAVTLSDLVLEVIFQPARF